MPRRTRSSGIRALCIGLCLAASGAQAHSVTPEDVIASFAPAALRARFGIVDVSQAAELPRLLVIRVDRRWSQVSPEQRRKTAQSWRLRWRASVPQGLLAIVDARNAASLVSFDLAGRAFGVYGLPTLAVGRPMRNRLLYSRLERSRTRGSSVVLVERDRAAVPMLRALKNNRLVVVLIDQYSRRARGVFVPLFGARCSTSAGVATIALRSGATVICVTARRLGPDRHVIEVGPPLTFESTGDRKSDIEAATAAYNAALEQRIRACPEQWMWGHRRFRHSPDLDYTPYAS